MPTTSITKKAASDFRPRRSHGKSRNGDSVGESVPEAAKEEDVASQSPVLEAPDLSPSGSSLWPDNVFATESTTDSLSPYALAYMFEESDEARIPGVLSSQELELLCHYITHTSRIIPFDQGDLYALHVGIPNLALGNEPLMASLLALSAACKSHDIVKHSPQPLERLDEAAIHDVQQHDHVLANAALMVLYGSSSHCVRVSLAQMANRSGLTLDNELLPTQSQWMMLIRAAHTAFTGLLDVQNEDINAVFGSQYFSVAENSTFPTPGLSFDSVCLAEDGPSEGTKLFLLPAVWATYGPALDQLAAKVLSLQTQAPRDSGRELQACFAAHEILEQVFSAVFMDKETLAPYEDEAVHLGRMRSVSPWLTSYLGRVTSSTPCKPLRRSVMAFLNRVPLEYLHLVQSTLDGIPVPGHLNHLNWDDSTPTTMTSAHRLAMDMFAHWLVLVMLLDGVWWIGGIGEWELGRILSSAQARAEPGGRWWPESMYNVKRKLAQHMDKAL
ncbi:putative C6 transcription factor [Metarhizium anisopliae]|nr:putative C6 transcription factor [Metarhizium anisopliae]